MQTIIHQRVAQAQAGQNPTVIRKLASGWVVLGDVQVLNGYCLLLPDPVVASLNEMPAEARLQFLADMAKVGDALLKATAAARINYEILGNSEPALHAHIVPRYAAEPEEYRKGPVWFYDLSQAPGFDPQRHKPLMERIGAALDSLATPE